MFTRDIGDLMGMAFWPFIPLLLIYRHYRAKRIYRNARKLLRRARELQATGIRRVSVERILRNIYVR